MGAAVRSIKILALSGILGVSSIITSCQRTVPSRTNNRPGDGPNSTPRTDGTAPATPDPTPRPSPRTPLESTLSDIAGFDFIQVVVFTRLDGKQLDTADYDFLKANAPNETNQWRKTTDGLHAVAGTNFVFSSAQLGALRKQLKVEDVTAEYGRKR